MINMYKESDSTNISSVVSFPWLSYRNTPLWFDTIMQYHSLSHYLWRGGLLDSLILLGLRLTLLVAQLWISQT